MPNACEELVEQQQSRSVVGEKGVSEEPGGVRQRSWGRLSPFSHGGEKGPELGWVAAGQAKRCLQQDAAAEEAAQC